LRLQKSTSLAFHHSFQIYQLIGEHVISALLSRDDEVLEDKLNHASLIDGGLMSGARFRRYAHADMLRLEQILEKANAAKKLIVSDGVFSMDGDEAPMTELVGLAHKYQAALMIDDAHGMGVLGETGAGLLEQQGLNQQQVPILMATLGKALGTFGAFVAGSDELIEFLIQYARSYIYTTAPPPAVMAATRVSLRLCQQESWRREKLKTLIQQFRIGAQQLGLCLLESATPIQPIIFSNNETTVKASQFLFSKGFLVGAIRSPTVPKGSERLRITFSAEHTEADINGLLSALSEVAQ
jgi:8-amino-7-oxononanoate synthase